MTETQQTIGAWAKATFPGGDDMGPARALRLLDEVTELCLAAGAKGIDVAARVQAAVLGSFPSPRVLTWHEAHPRPPEEVAAEMADVAIALDTLAHARGVDLRAEVDRKMSVNRARRWHAHGDGTGQHIKD